MPACSASARATVGAAAVAEFDQALADQPALLALLGQRLLDLALAHHALALQDLPSRRRPPACTPAAAARCATPGASRGLLGAHRRTRDPCRPAAVSSAVSRVIRPF
jgi:hypothetical protein